MSSFTFERIFSSARSCLPPVASTVPEALCSPLPGCGLDIQVLSGHCRGEMSVTTTQRSAGHEARSHPRCANICSLPEAVFNGSSCKDFRLWLRSMKPTRRSRGRPARGPGTRSRPAVPGTPTIPEKKHRSIGSYSSRSGEGAGGHRLDDTAVREVGALKCIYLRLLPSMTSALTSPS